MTSPVEEIRQAAELMRRQAQAAREVPVEVWITYFSSTEGAYYASWHPGVTLPIADLFDALAYDEESGRLRIQVRTPLLKATRAYLGGPSDG